MKHLCSFTLSIAVLLVACGSRLIAADIPLRAEELPTKLGVGYAVRLLDMNGDKKLDICIVDQTRILWLENPTWKEHVIIDKQTRPDRLPERAVLREVRRLASRGFVLRQNSTPEENQPLQEVVKNLNRDVIYQNGLDITDDVLKALNEAKVN